MHDSNMFVTTIHMLRSGIQHIFFSFFVVAWLVELFGGGCLVFVVVFLWQTSVQNVWKKIILSYDLEMFHL